MSFKKGLQQLPQTAQQRLGEKCQLGWEAMSLKKEEDGSFQVSFNTPSDPNVVVRAKTVVVTAPSAAAAALLSPMTPSASELASIASPPVFAVTIAYPSSAFARDKKCVSEESGKLSAFGVLIPRSSGLETLGYQCISSLFPSRAPAGQEVLLAYFGGAQNSNVADMSEAEVVAKVHADAQTILLQPNTPLPEVLSVRKWTSGIPQYNVGHKKIVDSVRGDLPQGIILGGNALGGGISLGDCAEGGWKCAQQALSLL